MSKLTRVTSKLFGSNAGANQIAEFGSLAAANPTFTTNPATIQSLSQYLTGWFGAVLDGNSPAIEDMNALCFLFSYQIGYVLQNGVAEWDSGTTYYTDSIVNYGSVLYVSLVDNNLNQVPSSVPADWKVIASNPMTATGDIIYGTTNGVPAALSIGSSNKFLKVISGLPAWSSITTADLSGTTAATSVGALDVQTGDATGLRLVAGVLSQQSASATVPGVVNIAAQSFAGLKTFTNGGLFKGLFLNRTAQTSTYTTVVTDGLVDCSASGGSFVLTLLTAVGNTGLIQVIKKTDTSANTVTINTTSAQTIDGRASASIILSAPNDYLEVISNGTNWEIIDKKETAYLTQTSSEFAFTGGTSNTYAALANNSISLTPGQWTVSGYFELFVGSASVNTWLSNAGCGFYAANGANSSSVPAALSGTFGSTAFVGSAASTFLIGNVANSGLQTGTVSFDIYVSTTTSVFLVPKIVLTTAGAAAVTAVLSAKRVW